MKKLLVLCVVLVLVLGGVLPAQARAQFDIGFRVTTVHPTNVVVRYRVSCNGVVESHRIQARTPLVRHVSQTVPDATECHIDVRAWDIKPHAVPPPDYVPPEVKVWVRT